MTQMLSSATSRSVSGISHGSMLGVTSSRCANGTGGGCSLCARTLLSAAAAASRSDCESVRGSRPTGTGLRGRKSSLSISSSVSGERPGFCFTIACAVADSQKRPSAWAARMS